MMRKILLRSQSLWQLLIACIGAFLGMLLFVVAVQFYLDLSQALLQEKDLIGNDYLVIQKKISTLNTLSISSNYFSSEEIEELKAQPFVKEIGQFKSSLFKVYATVSGFENSPDLITDAYFESVPNQFIDVESEDWKWNANDDIIPVILPSAYLDAFNFGFGPSQGLPPLSEKAFKLLSLKVIIKAPEANYLFKGKICGFSDRINTILVPQNFLDFANAEFATKKELPPARLIISTYDSNDPKLANYIESHHYDTNSENLKGSRIKSVLLVVLSVLLLVGSVIILLSLLGFVQYGQVLIAKINYEIKVMLLMGYSYRKLAMYYVRYFSVLIGINLILAFSTLYVLHLYFVEIMLRYGLETQPQLSPFVFLIGIGFVLLFLFVNSISLVINLKDLAKNLQ